MKRRSKKADAADRFRDDCIAAGLPAPQREYHFHDTRNFRFDCAWLDDKLAVEIHGGTARGGRHVTAAGMDTDCNKANLAVLLGWRVLVFTTRMLGSEEKRRNAVAIVAAALNGSKPPWHLAMTERQAAKALADKGGMFDA